MQQVQESAVGGAGTCVRRRSICSGFRSLHAVPVHTAGIRNNRKNHRRRSFNTGPAFTTGTLGLLLRAANVLRSLIGVEGMGLWGSQ
jgi:hypothetical protein